MMGVVIGFRKFIIIFLSLIFLIISTNKINAQPDDQSANVGVSGLAGCQINLNVRPEKRVLSPNPNVKQPNPNRQTSLNIQIYQGANKILEHNATSNNQGLVSFNPCLPSFPNTLNGFGNQTYTLYISGTSHLRRLYTSNVNLNNFVANLNFIQDNTDVNQSTRSNHYASFLNQLAYENYSQDLYAGEVSVNFDNIINSLDFSALISKYSTNDNKMDLNQDNVVNALDFSVLSTNYWKAGDLLPGQSWGASALNFISARNAILSN